MISRTQSQSAPQIASATFDVQGKVRRTEINVKDYGAQGDTQLIIDGAITSGTKNLTSATGLFTAADVGKVVTVKGAGSAGARLNTTIAAYVSSTAVTLTAAASTTVTGAHVIWGTDDLNAFNAAYAAAEPTAANVKIPPGGYGLSNTVSFSPAASAVKSCRVPGLISDSMPGRIGDGGTSSYTDEINAVSFYPLGAFPQGNLLIDFVSRDNVQSLNGANVGGFGLICENIAAGMRISNTRKFDVKNIDIDHAALPALGGSVLGAFNALQQGGTSTAYNTYTNITTAYSAGDGIVHNAAGDDVFLNCYDLNASGYAYRCTGFGRFIACHYEQSGHGWYIQSGSKPNMVIGAEFFGVPIGNAVQLVSGGLNFVTQFISCNFQNIPGSSPGESAGAVIVIKGSGTNPVLAKFIGCNVETNANTTDFIYVEPGVAAGSSVSFTNTRFRGTPTNALYNDASGNNVLSFWQCEGIANLITAASSLIALAGSNKIPLTVTQNDVTNNPNALNISNAGTGIALNITHNGGTNNPAVQLVATGTTGGGNNVLGMYLNSTTATTGAAFNAVWNSASFTGISGYGLVNVRQTNASASGNALVVEQSGTGLAILVKSGQSKLAASATTNASLNIPSGTAPSSPGDGDVWYDGTNLKMRVGAVTKTFTLT